MNPQRELSGVLFRNNMTGDRKQDRPVFRLTLRPEPHVADPVYALRGLLKRALRSYGLRAIDVVVEEAPRQYDSNDDIAKSVQEGFRAIRDRVANGGPGWKYINKGDSQ